MIIYRVYYPVDSPDLVRACHDYCTREAASGFARGRNGAVVRKLTITTKKKVGHDWSWALIQLAKGKKVRRVGSEQYIVLSRGTPTWADGQRLSLDTLAIAAGHTDWVLA